MVLVAARRAPMSAAQKSPRSIWDLALAAIDRLGHCECSHRKDEKANAIHEFH